MDHESRETVAQCEMNSAKKGEITAVRTFLKESSLEKANVTLDALHMNPKTTAQIHHAGGHYLIQLKRNQTTDLGCDIKLFKKIVKAAFNQRRKTLKNGIKAFTPEGISFSNPELLTKRPEQLSVADFVQICSDIEAAS